VRGATEAARPNEAAREAVIAEHLKALKLPSFGREYQSLARRAADGGWAYEDYLRELLEVELHDREERTASRLLKVAKFPDLKTLDQLDWAALKGVSRQKIMQLASCEYLTKAEDVVLAGPIGTGKTHVAISLGVEATRRRFRVAFVRTSELVRSLLEARDERTLTRLHRRFERVDLLILDELGFVPFKRAEGELLFELLSERYEQRSTIVTTNLAFGEWVEVFRDEKLTTALLDRLSHHSHILTTTGSSFRTRTRTTNGPTKGRARAEEK
jgi:DNA replication protein DnaC